MQDRPSANILLEAIADFLIKEILPITKDNDLLSYKTLVSWNMLEIISRELKYGEKFLTAELERLSSYLNKEDNFLTKTYQEKLELAKLWNKELSEKIREKKIFNPHSVEWNLVKLTLREKLEIANPKFLQGE
jgi:hypothetical protein